MEKLEQYLHEFSKVADSYFKEFEGYFLKRFELFNTFFTKEYIDNLTWEKVQIMGENIHAFVILPLAKKRALGRPNHDISKYKETFSYMTFSNDPIDLKMDNLITGIHKLAFIGKSVMAELIGYVKPDKYYIYNKRDKLSLEFLGLNLNFKRGDSFGTQYSKYLDMMQSVAVKYNEIVGKRSATTIPLEVDQFFNWLYENYIQKEESGLDVNKIDAFVQEYKIFITSDKYDELYKWQAVKNFQDNWNIDVPDFKTMFNNCFPGQNNLWVSRNFYPISVMNDFIDMDTEKVRSMFRMLFDEDKSLTERVGSFLNDCEFLRSRINKPNYNQHYHNAYVVSLYLSFRYPGKYFLYKTGIFKSFSKKVGFITTSSKVKSDKLLEYFKTAEKIRTLLLEDEELLNVNKSHLNHTCYKDENHNWLTQDFIYFVSQAGEESTTENVTEDKGIKYWAIAPGELSAKWEEWKENNFITIGWDYLGDLSVYPDKESIRNKLKEEKDPESSHKNSTLACFQFTRVMKPGDVIFVKTGTKYYLGMGVVTSDYIYDASRLTHRNIRKVNWLKLKNVEIPQDVGPVAIKTLTDITKYPEYIEKVRKLFDSDYLITKNDNSGIVSDEGNINYWWLNANPNIWNIEDFNVGDEQAYTSHNNKGNKRRVYEHFTNVKKGDLMIGYVSSPIRKVKALFEVVAPLHMDDDEGEMFSFVVKEFFPYPVPWDEMIAMESLQNADVFKNNQGSLFKLTKEEFSIIYNLAKNGETLISSDKSAPVEVIKPKEIETYTKQSALHDLFISDDKLDSILDALKVKKNIILQGPPGTGKTYIAKKIAYLMLGKKDNTKIEQIQFHQSYSYEDFIQGYRPSENSNFIRKNGIFYYFCKRAQKDLKNPYFFIIDEINRGNLSKILGELMMLIENDKRGPEFAISLTYSKNEEEKFYIPENVHLIGTMNTADRSLAIVDYALRRRFRFVNIKPIFNEKFRKYLKDNNVPNELISKIVEGISKVNKIISGDQNLGEHYEIGHSYFCNIDRSLDVNYYNRIIDNEIGPLLEEYWYDENNKVEDCIKFLKG